MVGRRVLIAGATARGPVAGRREPLRAPRDVLLARADVRADAHSRSPRIAVIIPARDAASTLAETLSGLAAQRFATQFEVIVVDDGSTDQTPRLAKQSDVVDRVVRV